jgi:hypothetical protein
MSREVSVEELIEWAQARAVVLFQSGCEHTSEDDLDESIKFKAVAKSLRRSVLLERLYELVVDGDISHGLQDAIIALRDHDKLGKEGKCRSCGGLGTLGCTYPDHGDSTSDHACGDETCGDCGGTGRIKLGKEG